MKLKVEVSNPHYHPGKGFSKKVTKKRDLSVPPHWVANERINKNGKSYAIVMPERKTELYEDRQELHIHMSEYQPIVINGQQFWAKIKVQPGEYFASVVHFDDVDAKEFKINGGEEAIL